MCKFYTDIYHRYWPGWMGTHEKQLRPWFIKAIPPSGNFTAYVAARSMPSFSIVSVCRFCQIRVSLAATISHKPLWNPFSLMINDKCYILIQVSLKIAPLYPINDKSVLRMVWRRAVYWCIPVSRPAWFMSDETNSLCYNQWQKKTLYENTYARNHAMVHCPMPPVIITGKFFLSKCTREVMRESSLNRIVSYTFARYVRVFQFFVYYETGKRQQIYGFSLAPYKIINACR